LLFLLPSFKAEFEDYIENPYKVLKMPPWSNYTQLKAKYSKLVKELHPDKNKNKEDYDPENFRKVQDAWERIKKERSPDDKEEESDIVFWNMFAITITYLVSGAAIMIMVYIFLYISFHFYSKSWKLLFVVISSFIVCEKIIPHWFDSFLEQYCYSLFIGLASFYGLKTTRYVRKRLLEKIKTRYSNVNNVENNYSNQNEYHNDANENDGKRVKHVSNIEHNNLNQNAFQNNANEIDVNKGAYFNNFENNNSNQNTTKMANQINGKKVKHK
jgi:curved DNA-binding protein CbpA